MVGYFNFKNNRYENAYGTPIKCFKCGENKCNGTKSFPLQFGGYGELIHCEKHEKDAIKEVLIRERITTDVNNRVSGS
jgi:hypothetical protein